MFYEHEERDVSCFANLEGEDTTLLADYFSDGEEDNLANFDEIGEISDEEDTWSKHSATNFGLKPIPGTDYEEEEKNKLNEISGIANKPGLNFSKWQPYIPPEHAFQSFAAQSWSSACLQQGSSSQEPTLTQISTITEPSNATRQTPAPRRSIRPQQGTTPSQSREWPSSRPATKHCINTWKKPWPESKETCSKTQNSHSEFPDHQGQSKRYKLWKRQLPRSPRNSQNRNTKFQNTQPATDVGNEPQVFIQSG